MEYEEYRNKKGQYHRIDGPAYINDIRKVWYYKGQFHRLDGPAYIEGNYYKVWCMNGGYHRLEGPAYINGDYQEWWINHKSITNPEDYIHEIIEDCAYGIWRI